MESRRPTQKDVARKAGVTQAAVSLALSNHPSIAPETRRKIRKIADAMGYKPDPYLSGLSAYRKRVRPTNFQATLAWLSNYPEGFNWRQYPAFLGYYEGAASRAGELGYRLEEHCLLAKGMTCSRMERIFLARNIPGILVAPQPDPGMRLDFNFEHFSAVTFGFSLVYPQLHLVTLQQFRSMELAFRQLIALGYRRPGLALALESDQRADRNWSAAFWSEQRELPKKDRVPLLLESRLDRAQFSQWLSRYKPDVVVAIDTIVHKWILAEGLSVPEDIGCALLTVPEEKSEHSGIWENPQVIGARAVEFLVDLVHRGECGLPKVPVSLLVAGTWVEGHTVRTMIESSPTKARRGKGSSALSE